MSNKQILRDSIFKIGKITSVDGRKIKIKVDKTKNASHLLYCGELLKNVSVGGYIKIIKGFTKIIGKIEGEYINEDKDFSSKEYGNSKEKINRILNVSLLGFFKDNNRFERGIKELPLIDNECFLLDNNEFNQIHNFVNNDDKPITLGSLALEKGQEINVGINSLFASHIGIFGNTGSGKSYTLAKIYRELLQKYKDNNNFKKNAQIVLLDFNGEYVGENVIIETEYKNIYKLSTRNKGDKYPILKSTIYETTFWAIFLTATEKTQAPFLDRALRNTYFSNNFDNADDFKTIIKGMLVSLTSHNDKNLEKSIIINFLKEIQNCLSEKIINLNTLIDDYQQNLQWHSIHSTYFYPTPDNNPIYANNNNSDFTKTVIDKKIDSIKINLSDLYQLKKIHLKIIFQFYNEITKGYSNIEHIAPLIKRLDKRIIDLNKVIQVIDEKDQKNKVKNLTIISLKNVNIDMKKVMPLLICKQLYNDKKNKNLKNTYLNLIIDEAHNILSYSSERESESWKDYRLETFEEIIKEGRKFGVFLTIASQRPSDISSTIISQLHNYFLHRLINNNDILAVEKTISYLDKVSFDYLPILPTGTCILAGLLAQVPVVIDIGKIVPEKHKPDNDTIILTDNWDD